MDGITRYDVENPKGPVAPIMKDLRRLDMHMDDQFKIHVPGEILASIEHEPAELISRRVALASQRHALKKSAETKSILRGIRAIEQSCDGHIYKGLEEEGRKMLPLIATGALWTGRHSQKTGYEENPSCRMCGKETPTMTEAYRHIFWRCEKVREVRQAA